MSNDEFYKSENPPAFPQNGMANQGAAPLMGMTLRDYFAAHAPFTPKDAEGALANAGKSTVTHSQIHLWLAQMRYSYADSMLAARNADH